MTDRDRLIELLGKNYNCVDRNKCLNEQADYLLANGVIVPVRCKDCDYYIPKAILTDEYDNPLSYD